MVFGATPTGLSPVAEAVRRFHADVALAHAADRDLAGLPLIAMGHMTCAGGEETEGSERRISVAAGYALRLRARVAERDRAESPSLYSGGRDGAVARAPGVW